ncbi:MAG: D-alanine--D-alanine ligase [Bacteroidaceae bacterium]|nr:D-alanine--D-alanine ligase [Bacteroidaceae bacterium]
MEKNTSSQQHTTPSLIGRAGGESGGAKSPIIAIVCGGDSSEHDVSLRSAQGIYSFIDKERFEVYIVELNGLTWEAHLDGDKRAPVSREDFSFKAGRRTVRPDFAYITIHGTPGEDGILQGYFDLIRLPYSTSGVLVEAMTFNKFTLNQYLKGFGVSVSESLVVRRGHEDLVTDAEILDHIGLPCFVKPNAGGSSFGVTKVKTLEQLRPAIALAMQESDEVMVEAFMPGTELTCGIYKTAAGGHVFPVTEVVTHNEFFDYDAKYNGAVDEITPARISDDLRDRVQALTSAIYDILGCSGIIRIDYIVTKVTGEDGRERERINMLEINTTPGMTATSFIPQQVRAAGLDIKDVLTEIIEDKL